MCSTLTWCSENLDPVCSVRALTVIGIANATFGQTAIQNIGTMTWALHPGSNHGFRCAEAGCSVLGSPAVAIPGLRNTGREGGTGEAGMAKIIVAGHVTGMRLGRACEGGVPHELTTSGGAPVLIHQVEHLGGAPVLIHRFEPLGGARCGFNRSSGGEQQRKGGSAVWHTAASVPLASSGWSTMVERLYAKD